MQTVDDVRPQHASIFKAVKAERNKVAIEGNFLVGVGSANHRLQRVPKIGFRLCCGPGRCKTAFKIRRRFARTGPIDQPLECAQCVSRHYVDEKTTLVGVLVECA